MQGKLFTRLKSAFMLVSVLSMAFSCTKIDVTTPQEPPRGFVLVRANSFTMGSAESEGYADERPQHKVTLSAFYLDTAELTRKKFLPFLKSSDTNYLATDQRKEENYKTDQIQNEMHPIVKVTWVTAVAYCNWVTKQTGSKDTCYTFTFNGDGTINALTIKFDKTKKGYRLPTEAEWEYACRAGSTTKYCFDDTKELLDAYAWYSNNSGDTIHAVGQKNANAFGLHDMHGNVLEWCWDFYVDRYPQIIDQVDPVGPPPPDQGYVRIIRGGNLNDDAERNRSASRYSGNPVTFFNYVGFRLAKSM